MSDHELDAIRREQRNSVSRLNTFAHKPAGKRARSFRYLRVRCDNVAVDEEALARSVENVGKRQIERFKRRARKPRHTLASAPCSERIRPRRFSVAVASISSELSSITTP